MKNQDETGSEVLGMVELIEGIQDDLPDRFEKTVKKGAVFLEEMPKFFRDRKDTVPVFASDEYSCHCFGTFPCIKVATGRAEAGVATERNEMPVAALGTTIHRTAECRITAVDHPVYVFDFYRTRMHGIYDLFIMVFEDFLDDVSHTTIMKETYAVVNQNPS